MKRLQLIFCVETNQQKDTDFKYIRNAIDKYYNYRNGNINLVPQYLGGKGRYATEKTVRKINTLIKKFKGGADNGESYVLLCLDCDKYDSDPKDRKFLMEAEKYCGSMPNYRLVWFCRDVEDVFLGHQISDKQKEEEVKRFLAKKLIDNINIDSLLANQYRIHHSNLFLILNQFLIRKK